MEDKEFGDFIAAGILPYCIDEQGKVWAPPSLAAPSAPSAPSVPSAPQSHPLLLVSKALQLLQSAALQMPLS